MIVIEYIFEIRRRIEIWRMISKLIQQLSICSADNRELQGIHIWDLHPVGGKSVLNMYDQF